VPGGTKPRSTETEYVRYTPAVTDANGTVIVPAKLDDLGGFRPTAINNRGDVVGYGGGAAGDGDHPFVWSDGPNIWTNATSFPAELPQFADRSTLAFDINDNGQIAGLNNFHYRAWRFTPGVGYENLGSGYKGKYNNSSGHAINNNGDVACESSGGSSVSACRYTDADGFDKLGTLGGNSSYCNGGGINSAGDMVGYSETSDGGMHVFLETADLGMVDLETAITNLPADLGNKIRSSGMDINDTGVVLGRAGDGSGLQPSLLGHTYEAYVLKRLPTP